MCKSIHFVGDSKNYFLSLYVARGTEICHPRHNTWSLSPCLPIAIGTWKQKAQRWLLLHFRSAYARVGNSWIVTNTWKFVCYIGLQDPSFTDELHGNDCHRGDRIRHSDPIQNRTLPYCDTCCGQIVKVCRITRWWVTPWQPSVNGKVT